MEWLFKRCNACAKLLAISDFYATAHGKCKKCRSAIGQVWRKNNPEKARQIQRRYDVKSWKIHHLKHWARNKTFYALKRGVISRMPCEVCGIEKAEAHHDDYSKPLELRWFCKEHHEKHHHKTVAVR